VGDPGKVILLLRYLELASTITIITLFNIDLIVPNEATTEITLSVNGTKKELTVPPQTLLVHALREELDYTGPKVGCESSLCGACTIRMDGRAVKSCTVLAAQADGAEIETVEGLEDDDKLHVLQETFREEHGLQCGYCTPGMLMTTSSFLEENPAPTREEIREAIEGNLCRCTGYQNIINAVESAANKLSEGSS
jgi:carbon-monoxide dehydrogenase small subunit